MKRSGPSMDPWYSIIHIFILRALGFTGNVLLSVFINRISEGVKQVFESDMRHISQVNACGQLYQRPFKINECALCLRGLRVPILTHFFYYGYRRINFTPF